jgi:hypothetical protein
MEKSPTHRGRQHTLPAHHRHRTHTVGLGTIAIRPRQNESTLYREVVRPNYEKHVNLRHIH